jgi:predicted negative regulator of RcsB-dependent stress response
MLMRAKIVALMADINHLESALKDTPDTRIRQVIEFRLGELRLELHRLKSAHRVLRRKDCALASAREKARDRRVRG